MSSFSRYIPANVREKLRREINFGCPVVNCGIPYLKYHHFDPPFSVLEKTKNPQHKPEKIIALCSEHADKADGGKWSNNDIKKMKKQPFITDILKSKEFGYLREKIVCNIGNVAYDVPNVLEIDGERVIGFERDFENNLRLNILIRDAMGNKILVMENNDWIVHPKDLFDLECPPQGKEIRIETKDGQTKFKMRFDNYSLEDFRKLLLDLQTIDGSDLKEIEKKLEWMKQGPVGEEEFNRTINSMKNPDPKTAEWFITNIGSPETVTVFSATGTLKWRNSVLKITNKKIEDLNTHSTFDGNLFVGTSCALSFKQTGGFSLG